MEPEATPQPSETPSPAPTPAPPVSDPPAPPAVSPPPATPATPPTAPAGLEAFWDGEKAALKVEDLAKLVSDDQARRAGIPEGPDGYKLELPAEFKLPDGLTFKPADTPLGQSVRSIAHEFGLPQAGLSKLLAAYVDAQAKEHQQVAADIAAEQAKLGPNRDARFSAMDGWLKANLPDHHGVLAQRLPVDAGLFQAVEALIARASPTIPAGNPALTPSASDALSALYPSMKKA